ncbi:MAG: dihydroneopterin aldolase [Bacteroidales bacterium]|nr:dihydroneopterin aldolase [Bacteroidales bacterium]
MGTIKLEGMKFRANIGTTEQERAAGNDVEVSVSYCCDTETPGLSDRLEDAVDYSLIYDAVAAEMRKECNLIENAAMRILLNLKENFPLISNITVTLCKYYPAVAGSLEKSVVEVKG